MRAAVGGVVHQHALGDLEPERVGLEAGRAQHGGDLRDELRVVELAGRRGSPRRRGRPRRGRSARQRAACVHALPSTAMPSERMRSVSSATRMNSSGGIEPSSGWLKRASASTPRMRGRRHRDDRLEVHVDLVVVERERAARARADGRRSACTRRSSSKISIWVPPSSLARRMATSRVAQQLFGVAVARARRTRCRCWRAARAGARWRGGSAPRSTSLELGRRGRATGSMPVTSLHITMNSSPAMRPTRSMDAGRALQPLGDLGQHLVAARVAERVVDELEAVEVDEQHRGVRLRAAAACQRVLQGVDEHHAVAQAGELVVRGAVAQLLLGVDGLGDVGERAHRARGAPEVAGSGRQLSESQRSLSPVTRPMSTSCIASWCASARATGWSSRSTTGGGRRRRRRRARLMQSTRRVADLDVASGRMRARRRVGRGDDALARRRRRCLRRPPR